MMIFTSQHAVWVVTLIGTLTHMVGVADPEAHPLSKLLRASHTVTGQNQCMVHAHGVCALGALVDCGICKK